MYFSSERMVIIASRWGHYEKERLKMMSFAIVILRRFFVIYCLKCAFELDFLYVFCYIDEVN